MSFQSPLEAVSWEVSRAHAGWQTVPYWCRWAVGGTSAPSVRNVVVVEESMRQWVIFSGWVSDPLVLWHHSEPLDDWQEGILLIRNLCLLGCCWARGPCCVAVCETMVVHDWFVVQQENERIRQSQEAEEKLMVTAWYNLVCTACCTVYNNS